MKLLLDTHVWLWWLSATARVPTPILAAIESAADVRLSAVCVWETVIKVSIGKLELPLPAAELLEVSYRDAGMQPLPVDARHALAVRELPDLHRDPFDRLLVAQARVEGLTLVTADARMRAYDVPLLAV